MEFPTTPPPSSTTSTISETLLCINLVVTVIGFFIEILIFFALIFNVFKKNSSLNSGFFIIFSLGCGIDLAYCIAKILMEATQYTTEAISIYANLAQWYCLLFFPFWMTVLALNRLTALIFMRFYGTLWSRKALILICLSLIGYPFALDGFTFFTDISCRLNTYSEPCESFMITTMKYTVIVGTAHACSTISIGLSTFAFIVQHQKRQKMSSQTKIEFQLLFQSVFSSFGLVVVCFFELWAAYEVDSVKFAILRHISNILFALWHFLSIILLIAVSKPFRIKFFEFYHLAKFLKMKQSASSKIFVNRIGQNIA